MADYNELDLGYVGEGGGNVDTVDGIEPDELKNVQIRFFVTEEWWKDAKRPLPPGRYIIVDGGGDIGPLIDQKIADHNAAAASHPDKAKRYAKTYPVVIAAGEFVDDIRITEISGAIALSDGSEITETGIYQYDEPVEITGTSGIFKGSASITVDYDLSDLVEKVDSEITERKQTEGNLSDLQTDNKNSLTAAINESYQKALKKLSEVTQNLYSNIALKTYTEQGTGQIKAYQLLGTSLDGAIHTLIELAQYGAVQQVEVGSETIHLNLNTLGGVGLDNPITVDTHDDEGQSVKLSLAYLADVINQCAQALQSAKDYADEKDAALRVDALILQPPCNESELPQYDPDNPWDPSHNGYWYQIKDFDVSHPGKNYKGTATWHDDLGEGEPGYYLATDNYGHADGLTTQENEEGQIAVTDITKEDVAADTNPFTALSDIPFLDFVGSVIKKINGAFQLTASLNTMIGQKVNNTQDIAEPEADTGMPEAVEQEPLPTILQSIWNFIAGRVPTDRSFGGLDLSQDRSVNEVKTELNITAFDDEADIPDDNLHATLTDEAASNTLPAITKTTIRSLLQGIRNNLKYLFTNKANLNSPVFTGVPQVPNKETEAGQDGTLIATEKQVYLEMDSRKQADEQEEARATEAEGGLADDIAAVTENLTGETSRAEKAEADILTELSQVQAALESADDFLEDAIIDLSEFSHSVTVLTWSDYFTPVNANIQVQAEAVMYRSGGEARLRLPFLNNTNEFTSNTSVFNPVAGKITTPNLGTFYGVLYTTNGGLVGTCWIQGINNILVITPLPGATIAANTGLVLDIRFPL
jgi:hypothetical protein